VKAVVRAVVRAVELARCLSAHELRLIVSIALWAARRRHGIRSGRAFGYVRGQGAMMFGFGFVCVLETVALAVLLRPWPAVERPVLVLDLYGVLQVVGMHAASVSRPHVLDATALRIRRAAHLDLRVPLDLIASVRLETRYTHEKREGELALAVGAQTTITLELTESIRHFTFLGRPRDVRLIRFHADEPDVVVRAIREMRTLAPAPRT